MLDDNPVAGSNDDSSTGSDSPEATPAKKAPARKAAAKKAPAKKAAVKKTAAKKSSATAAAAPDDSVDVPLEAPAETAGTPTDKAPAKKAAAKKTAAKKTTTRKTAAKKTAPAAEVAPDAPAVEAPEVAVTAAAPVATPAAGTAVLFQAPDASAAPTARRATRKTAAKRVAAPPAETVEEPSATTDAPDAAAPTEDAESTPRTTRTRQPRKRAQSKKADEVESAEDADQQAVAAEQAAPAEPVAQDESGDDEDGEGGGGRRRRRRGGRRRRKSGDGDSSDAGSDSDSGTESGGDSGAREGNGRGGQQDKKQDTRQDSGRDGGRDGGRGGNDRGGRSDDSDDGGDGTSRRRRRRRRAGDDGPEGSDDPQNTVTRVRKQRSAEDEITAISGSTRLEAKKQRRRDGREAGRRRAPIVSEAEFLARRESVDRVMVIRQRDDLTQIGVLEDKVLVEHYVARESQTSIIGNVYLGRVQNVLPSMEAAFIDIGKGRNAVLYAGEVNWSALGHKDGQQRKIESVLSSGQSILVQVTKDPIGHKGARLTSQVSLAGRFLVYVPDGTTSGISRKLPDTERSRLKNLLKEIVPDSAGVIVRTAAEGASEDELTRDVERLKARWEDIEGKLKGSSPQLLYGEPDLTLKVVRDLFTEDFKKLVIEGDDAWDTVQGYVKHVAPDLEERLERYDRGANNGKDIFAAYRVEEQIAKGLDRKVWLPSGGSLVIDRTEAMTVVDVNTGKFTGSGGNLEETVTKNNLEAAEEMVRQLRLRDIGGIIVIDFIDMVLESNRDLVLRRLVECLGRDRTRHQVAEVTSLGLVQMTRKRIGTGLVEAFSTNCEHCQGRGVVIEDAPVEPRQPEDESRRGGARRSRGGRGGGQDDQPTPAKTPVPSPSYVAAVAKPENAAHAAADEPTDEADRGRPSPTEAQPQAQPEAPGRGCTRGPGAQGSPAVGVAAQAARRAPPRSLLPPPKPTSTSATRARADPGSDPGRA